ncbi:hypothetical protein D3C72_95620 [compost metagenome]
MSSPRLNRVGDLEIDQHLGVQRFSWRIQRIGMVAIVLFLGAALSGLLGHGPLTRARAGSPDRLEVEYGRFERRTQETTMFVRLGPQPGGTVRLWMDADYVVAQPIQRVIPEPEGVELLDERLVMTLRVAGERPEILITTRPEAFGAMQARLGLLDGPEVVFDQFVYP